MQFQQLERIKSKHPRLSPQIDALAHYISSELEEGRKRIVPALAAARVGRSEAETLAVMMLFEDAGLLSHRYEIVCERTRTVLLSVSDKSELERVLPLYCKFCDCEHNADDLRIELVFDVKPATVPAFQQHVFA